MKYRDEVLRTTRHPRSRGLEHAAMGLAGEAGEVVDVLKKHLIYERELDRDHLIEELGDVLWYAELIMHNINVTREEVEQANIAKLRKRYP